MKIITIEIICNHLQTSKVAFSEDIIEINIYKEEII